MVKNSSFQDVKILFGTSGWRGTLSQDFIAPNVRRAAQGVAEYYMRHLRQGSILIGFDPRRGNNDFAREVAYVLSANDVPTSVILEEPTPTPVLAYLAGSDEQITGVINLTASHNKYTDDGFKFSPHHGGAADKETTDLISRYANEANVCRKISVVTAEKKGLIREISVREAVDRYAEGYIIPTLKKLNAWDVILDYVKSEPTFKLILDPMQGTSVKYLKAIYSSIEREAGRSFVKIIHSNNRDPEFKGVNGAPNPTKPESIEELVLLVSKDTRTLGLATDGDGDRFGVVDFGGGEIHSNEVIALLAHFLTQRGMKGVVGKTVATSGFVNAVAEYLGLDVIETPVGFKWFVEKAVNEKVEFLVAGEESAHVGVNPFMKSWDDGVATGVMCLWMIAETKESLSSYIDALGTMIGKRFDYERNDITLTPELKDRATLLIEKARQEQKEGKCLERMAITQVITSLNTAQKIEDITTLDGLKVVFENGDWFCIRLSGTESVARLYTETSRKKDKEFLQYLGIALLGMHPRVA